MMQMDRRQCLDEYEKLLIRMNTPRVLTDNASCLNATRVMIDSARKDEILLEAVQVLTDLNLSIKKGYVSSDGRWNMDVFHVTDLDGNKLTDDNIITCIEQSLETIHNTRSKPIDGMTALELTGSDRVGLLSEIFAVLSDLKCDIVESKVWTHNGRIASLIYLKDTDSGYQIEDSNKINTIKARLRNVLKGDNDIRSAKTSVSMAVTHTERRLHQMMFADRDYARSSGLKMEDSPLVSVQNCLDKGYSVLNIQSKDRPKLLFDVVCTLTDMQYVVFHATINTTKIGAHLEFFIKHMDGTPISSEAEKERVILCLSAAIERRASEGVRLELRKADKPGLLAEVMRIFRENALNIIRAEISTKMGTAVNMFYVTDAIGNRVDSKVIDSVRQRIGMVNLKVKEPSLQKIEIQEQSSSSVGGAVLVSLGSLLRRNLYNLGLIKSYS
ncbi:hypothetical protein L2E82_47581 [Cichorium intybus]|uniref:Uncharacterized protein n=1 Tax=Cichorium intybus TaxID=13427 RepID=A0ACB8YWE2_CICIN|nr:hypothetical protein L2E82_47581 [Cichorium intybus]